MELKEHLRKLARYKGKLILSEIIETIEKSATDGKYQEVFFPEEVLDEDMYKLRSMGLEVEFYGTEFNPYWEVRW